MRSGGSAGGPVGKIKIEILAVGRLDEWPVAYLVEAGGKFGRERLIRAYYFAKVRPVEPVIPGRGQPVHRVERVAGQFGVIAHQQVACSGLPLGNLIDRASAN